MKGLFAAFLFVAALGPLGVHGQQMFKCVSATGKTSFQEEPCQAAPPGKGEPAKTAPASPRGNAPQLKAGWEARELEAEDDACAKPILAESRKYFEMQSRSFPEAQIVPPVDRYCMCVTRRAAATWAHAEYSKNPAAHRERVTAGKDGPCKPDGLLAEMWRKTGKIR